MKLITIEEHYTNQKVIDANAKYAPKRQLTQEQQKVADCLLMKKFVEESSEKSLILMDV